MSHVFGIAIAIALLRGKFLLFNVKVILLQQFLKIIFIILDKLEDRVKIINDFFTFSLFSNVCRSLFEKHKMLFAFLVCVRIMLDDGKIDPHEWHHFLAGGSPMNVS